MIGTVEKSENKTKTKDDLLVVVTAKIFRYSLRATIDSGAAYSFLSSLEIIPLGISVTKDYIFLELGDGQQVLSKGKVTDVPIDIADITVRMDLTITLLLHDADIILRINWLQTVNPLID